MGYFPMMINLVLFCAECKRELLYSEGVYTHIPGSACKESDNKYIITTANGECIQVQRYGKD